MNETLSQLIDGVRTVQEDQCKITLILDKLATKVLLLKNRVSKIFFRLIIYYDSFTKYAIKHCGRSISNNYELGTQFTSFVDGPIKKM